MNDHYWRAISVDCIDPDYFPAVPLFVRTSGNYVLYKDAERSFTAADRSRLERNNTVRKAVPHQEAVRMMREESGKAFNAQLLRQFIELVDACKG